MRFGLPRFPAFARHWEILRDSWKAQNIADGLTNRHSDHEFLPAALEVIETPPSPLRRHLMLLICGFLLLALLWSVFGRIDVVSVAPGKTLPTTNVKIGQALEIGSVHAIHVRNGQFVKAGDLLIELDPTLANAQETQSEQALLAARMATARNEVLLAHANGRRMPLIAPSGSSADMVRAENAFVAGTVGQFEADKAALAAQRAGRVAELQGAEAELAKLRDALPFVEKQLSARSELTDKGYYSKLRLLEYQQMRAEHLRNIDVQRANAAQARATIAAIDAEIVSVRQNFRKAAAGDLTTASDKAALASGDVSKAVRLRQVKALRAPVDGVIQQLAVTTIGGVVQPAEPLMVIVPCCSAVAASCRGGIEVEAFVQNRDIGFVKVGQRVAVKLEAFDFTEYGLIEGEVRDISRDAIDRQADERAPGTTQAPARQASAGLVYTARISLDCAAADARRSPLCNRLQPGLAVQTEIKADRRRIIQYLFSPISRTVSEAARER